MVDDQQGRRGAGAREAGPRSGLDHYHQTATESVLKSAASATVLDERPEGFGCPARRGLVYLNLSTGETRPARCGRLACDYCATRNAFRRSLAIALAQPQRAITLTLLADAGDPDPWPTVRRRYRRVREWLKRMDVPPGEWVVHVEQNPQQTGYHGHIWQHGPKIPKAALQEAAHRAGAGWSRIEWLRSASGAAGYGLKGISYGLKGTDSDPSEYLRLNGGRLTHQSPGFFRSVEGDTVAVRVAEALALRAAFGEVEGSWTVTTDQSARSYRSVRPVAPGVALTRTGRVSVTLRGGRRRAGSTAAG